MSEDKFVLYFYDDRKNNHSLTFYKPSPEGEYLPYNLPGWSFFKNEEYEINLFSVKVNSLEINNFNIEVFYKNKLKWKIFKNRNLKHICKEYKENTRIFNCTVGVSSCPKFKYVKIFK